MFIAPEKGFLRGGKKRMWLRPLLPRWHAHLVWQAGCPSGCGSSAKVRDAYVNLDVPHGAHQPLSPEKMVKPEKACLHQPSPAERPEPRPALCSVLRFAFNSVFYKPPCNILCPIFCILHRGTPRLLIKHSAHTAYTSTISV